jgi:dTDP-4-amino-4,6-dideoxygalactose transaminase
MIKQKNHKLQYKLYKEEYDAVYRNIMENGHDSNGPYAKKVEATIRRLTGRKHVFMTMSGTSAITTAIYALDLFKKKVAVSSFNYSACVSQYQAFCKPVYVDCDQDTLIDLNKIPEYCDAVMLVNYWGNVVDYDQLKTKFKGKIIADCSQSFGAKYKGKFDGFFGDVATFAFGGQKPIGTRGFSGAIATDDDSIAHRIDCIINQGKAGENRNLPTEMMGFRGAPQELQCGLIHVGMKYWRKWQTKREHIAKYIMEQLKDHPLRFIENNKHCDSSYYKLAFEINDRDNFIQFMQKNGIDAQVAFIDNWSQVWGTGKNMPNTQRYTKHIASLPLSPFFTDKEIRKIVRVVKVYFDKVD